MFKKFSTGFPQVFHRFSTGFPQACAVICSLLLLFSINTPIAAASLGEFQPGIVVPYSVLYGLPSAFDSAGKIQAFLEAKGSVLAHYSSPVSFDPADDFNDFNNPAFNGLPNNLKPPYNIAPYNNGTPMNVSTMIWLLTQSSLANGCSTGDKSICYDNQAKPINPAFIIAMIQKESGLVYGAFARRSLSDPEVQFRLERVMGYYCFENPDRAKSCYDENPNWKFFKGFFRQVYYAIRLLRLWEKRCLKGPDFVKGYNGGSHYVGSTINVSGQIFKLESGIACAMFIYTPHVSSQNLVWAIMRELAADRDIVRISGCDLSRGVSQLPGFDYRPRRARFFNTGFEC
jgi:hypothetical protein